MNEQPNECHNWKHEWATKLKREWLKKMKKHEFPIILKYDWLKKEEMWSVVIENKVIIIYSMRINIINEFVLFGWSKYIMFWFDLISILIINYNN